MKTNTDSAFLSTRCASVFQRSSSASFAPLRENGLFWLRMIRVITPGIIVAVHSTVFAYEVGETVVDTQNSEIKVDKRTVEYVQPGKNELDKAIEDYNEALRLNPTHDVNFSNRGAAWHLKHDVDKAIADCAGRTEEPDRLT